jgi:hypothetical protein
MISTSTVVACTVVSCAGKTYYFVLSQSVLLKNQPLTA